MRHPGHSSNIAAYRAAVERLGQARESAIEKRAAAEITGDVAAGQTTIDELRVALDEFKEMRNKLDSRELFIARFNVEQVGLGRVSVVLPKGMSRSEFLEEAQAIAAEHHGAAIIQSSQLRTWCRQDRFKESVREPLRIEMLGIVPGSENKGLDAQRRHLTKVGLALPEMRDLAVAHAAYFVATGHGLVLNLAVRTSDGSVRHYPFGLEQESTWDEGLPFTFVAAAGIPVPPSRRWWSIFTRGFAE